VNKYEGQKAYLDEQLEDSCLQEVNGGISDKIKIGAGSAAAGAAVGVASVLAGTHVKVNSLKKQNSSLKEQNKNLSNKANVLQGVARKAAASRISSLL
jgi:hypothetical protein